MCQSATEKLQKHEPLLLHKLAKDAWGDGEKGLLSKAVFKDVVDGVTDFFSSRIRSLSQEELTALLTDYLRASGFNVASVAMAERISCITTSLITSDGIRLHGYAIATTRWSSKAVELLLDTCPTADFCHVLALEGIPKKPREKVKPITVGDIVRIATIIVVFDYFFDEYIYSITAMPGFKEYIYAYLEEQLGLTADRIDVVDTGWQRLKA